MTNHQNNQTKGIWNIIVPIIIFIIVISTIAGIIQLTGVGIDWLRIRWNIPTEQTKDIEETAQAPLIDKPPKTVLEVSEKPESFEILNLLSSSYLPSKNVMEKENYEKESVRLALSGDFDNARLHVKGTVINDGNHFILLNYDFESGILNAARLSVKNLDINLTQERGGIFTKNESIDFIIDLMGKTVLATTKTEFESTKQIVKFVKLWDTHLSPPTVVKILIAPFGEDGVFGGAIINEINFEYVCKKGFPCEAKICSSGKMITECLKDAFGFPAAKNWCDRIQGCKL